MIISRALWLSLIAGIASMKIQVEEMTDEQWQQRHAACVHMFNLVYIARLSNTTSTLLSTTTWYQVHCTLYYR